jgi:holo-[acyl-carrier protein] synthase
MSPASDRGSVLIKGIGIDSVEIARMVPNVTYAHFMERVFTAPEREYIGESNLAVERAAGNFAAKEALAKALGCGLAGCPLDKVEALRDAKGAPYFNVYGMVLRHFEELGVTKAWLSITHTGATSVAMVVLEGD